MQKRSSYTWRKYAKQGAKCFTTEGGWLNEMSTDDIDEPNSDLSTLLRALFIGREKLLITRMSFESNKLHDIPLNKIGMISSYITRQS